MTREECKGIWVFAEQENGVLAGTTFELLAKAHDLKEKLGGEDTVTAVLLGRQGRRAGRYALRLWRGAGDTGGERQPGRLQRQAV